MNKNIRTYPAKFLRLSAVMNSNANLYVTGET